jgi:hypothetical protein
MHIRRQTRPLDICAAPLDKFGRRRRSLLNNPTSGYHYQVTSIEAATREVREELSAVGFTHG